MKKILIIVLVICLVACNHRNKKEEIVTQEMAVKNKLANIQNKIDSLRYVGDTLTKTHIDSIHGQQDKYSKVESQIKVMESRLTCQKIPLQEEYDSLDMELRYY